MCNPNSGYNYGMGLTNSLSQAGLSQSDVGKVKIWQSDYPKEFPACGWVIPSERFVAQLDCHDDQNPGSSSRDMGDAGSVLVREKNVGKHRNFNIDLFKRGDGNWQIKLVLSSYTFMNNGAMGIPDGKSDCAKCVGSYCNSCSKSMPYSKAHDPNACGYTCVQNGSWKEGVYTRVHRDYDII